MNNITQKICGVCKESKDISCFGSSKQTKDGYRYECRECRKKDYYANHDKMIAQKRADHKKHRDSRIEKLKEYYQENKEEALIKSKEYYETHKNDPNFCLNRNRAEINLKKCARRAAKREQQQKVLFQNSLGTFSTLDKRCSNCKEVKSIWLFNKSSRLKTNFSKGRLPCCKKCGSENSKRYRKERPEVYKAISKRGNQTLNRRIASRLRHEIRSAVIRFKANKKEKTLDYLGCSLENLKLYLEAQFTEGMTWDKFLAAEIQIDHIIPFCSLDLKNEDNLRIICHYTNLRPLWKIDNQKKLSYDKSISLKTKQKHLNTNISQNS